MKAEIITVLGILTGSVAAQAANLAITVKPCNNSPQYICTDFVQDAETGQTWGEMGIQTSDEGVWNHLVRMVDTAEKTGASHSLSFMVDGQVSKVSGFGRSGYYQLTIHSLNSTSGSRPRGL